MVIQGMPDWAQGLGLEPHPEGGWFAETYRHAGVVDAEHLPGDYPAARSLATAILFLLLPGEQSAWHRVRSDELWLHHRGGPLELALGGGGPNPSETTQTMVLGPDLAAGQRVQAVVPANHWQSAHPVGDEPVLVSCVVCPGFDFEDFTLLD